ncbi:hypothetical protein BKA65DRAFT_558880 [Rhexocercosporidium sp. MPI-PUGE-AT-0058]|nr:hypothetical protein BKA65DRAFT_558880 [Rhexocercosporidium sp. MPI-PUGE-AT-0058]
MDFPVRLPLQARLRLHKGDFNWGPLKDALEEILKQFERLLQEGLKRSSVIEELLRALENADYRESKFMGDYWNSTVIDSLKSLRGLKTAAKYTKWQADFGLDAANELLMIVEKAMPEYKYIKSNTL